MTIHDTIRCYRYDLQITQTELSRRTGISQRDISFWESGRGDPRISDCIRLARGFGLSMEEFLGGLTLPGEDDE